MTNVEVGAREFSISVFVCLLVPLNAKRGATKGVSPMLPKRRFTSVEKGIFDFDSKLPLRFNLSKFFLET